MTFGTEWGWGSPAATARRIFDRFLDAGGNFVDTADGYTNGKSEEMLGDFMKEVGNRDRVVLATKYTFNGIPGDPNAGGNGRKNLMRALEGSLRRLKTDYVDLYWMHAWDMLTPVDEVLRSLDDAVRAGKIRYVGLSDVPAWYAARAQTLAEVHGWAKIVALQLEYSLVERTIEREFVSMAQELGMGITPWSPLASGLLTGKYDRSLSQEGRIRVTKDSGHPLFAKYAAEKNWAIVDALKAVAKEAGLAPAKVALQWVTKRPGVVSTIIGATKPEQMEDNLACLEKEVPAELLRKLDEVSHIAPGHPYEFFRTELQGMISGGTKTTAEWPWYRAR
jgi:aryl-alcohol dehydrogenase-like predicted oxidoreductase